MSHDKVTRHQRAFRACRFVIIPDMLKNAPMFKRIDPKMKVSSAEPVLPKLLCLKALCQMLLRPMTQIVKKL